MTPESDVQVREFQVLSEKWGRFDLPNRIVVLARIFLTGIGTHGGKRRQIRNAVHMEVMAPENKKGKPGNDPYRDQDVVETVTEFKTVRPAESRYELDDGSIMLLTYRPLKFKLTNKYNLAGEPVLGAEAETEIEIVGSVRNMLATEAGPAQAAPATVAKS